MEFVIRFSMKFTFAEFGETFDAIAEGVVDVRPALTDTVLPAGAAQAFDDLVGAERHAKIVVSFDGYG